MEAPRRNTCILAKLDIGANVNVISKNSVTKLGFKQSLHNDKENIQKQEILELEKKLQAMDTTLDGTYRDKPNIQNIKPDQAIDNSQPNGKTNTSKATKRNR